MAVRERVIDFVAACYADLVVLDSQEYGGRGVLQQPKDRQPVLEESPTEGVPTVTSSISGKTGFLS